MRISDWSSDVCSSDLSERNGTLYTGVTSDLIGRTCQHREHIVDGFTKRYRIATLVWYELQPTMEGAIVREKQIKKWNRNRQHRLIQEEKIGGGDVCTRVTNAQIVCRRLLEKKKKKPHSRLLDMKKNKNI